MRLNYAKLLIATFLAAAATALASTTWYVNAVSGNDANNCLSSSTACKTIGHAISLASSGDSIMVAAATYTENLTVGLSLKILGAGAATTIIHGGAVGTVVKVSSASAHVTLSNVTIRNGQAQFGAGISNSGTLTINSSAITNNHASSGQHGSSGGGITNNGSLTINKSTISGNSVGSATNSVGGGISNTGTITITNSTVSGNSAGGLETGSGGGIHNYGNLAINNSTVSGNSASGWGGASGGGISNQGTLTINTSTLSGNSASGHVHAGLGGGIYNHPGSGVYLQNSIIADSSAGGNCSGSMNSDGYNLSSDGTCNFNNTGDLNNTDPMLGPLQNNGGPTHTQALLAGSPAIDAGNPRGCRDGNGNLLKTDQRGQPRPDKEDSGGCDMGAYERQSD